MYAAAFPAAIAYYFVWNPPSGLEGDALFPYIVTIAVLVRTLVTVYEIPSSSLVAEMSDDYDERTSMLSYRYFFGWTGGTLMGAFATIFILVPTVTIGNGMFNVEGHGQVGAIAAMVIFMAMMLSSMGTHKMIPDLKAPPPPRQSFVSGPVSGGVVWRGGSRCFHNPQLLFLDLFLGVHHRADWPHLPKCCHISRACVFYRAGSF